MWGNKVLYGAVFISNTSVFFVSFCGELIADDNGDSQKIISELQNKINERKTKAQPWKIKFLIKFLIFDREFNFQRKINIAS